MTNYTDDRGVRLTVKFISREFEVESILSGNVTMDDKSQAYSMVLAKLDVDLLVNTTLDIDLL